MKEGDKVLLKTPPNSADTLKCIIKNCSVPQYAVPYTVTKVSPKGNIQLKELESKGKFWQAKHFKKVDHFFLDLFTKSVKRCNEISDCANTFTTKAQF